MLKNITSLFAGVLVVGMSMTGCIIVTDDGGTDSDTEANETTGETDTDPSGDGDGDASGDGDGDATDTDPATDTDTGDGDGDTTDTDPGTDTDTTGDGDGDATDTDTAPAPLCGWDPDNNYYECGFEGEDPGGENPIGCPADLVEGAPCADSGLTGQGCCDENGDNWYCTSMGEVVVYNACS